MSTEPEPPSHRPRRARAVARLAARARFYRGLAELYHQQLGASRRAGARLVAVLRSSEGDIAWLRAEVAARDALLAELRAIHSSRFWAVVQAYRRRPGPRGLLSAMKAALRASARR